MPDRNAVGRRRSSRGCLVTGLGAAVLALLAPFFVIHRGLRRWRRGSEIKKKIHGETLTRAEGSKICRIDFELDVPQHLEPEFRRRLTETVIRLAEALRVSDDVYHLVYRLPWDGEPVALPVGPQLQELGERFSLVQSHGVMSGRTAVWLTLGRERPLSDVVDPVTYDPEREGEPDALLTNPALRWSMATEWARVGPSLIVRLIVVVPSDAEERVKTLFESFV